MFNYFSIAFLLAFSASASGTSLFCEISKNTQKIIGSSVQSSIAEKRKIARTQGVTAYVLEKNDSQFVVEVFLENEEARFYAEGPLKTERESVIASFWNRDHIVEVSCKKLDQ